MLIRSRVCLAVLGMVVLSTLVAGCADSHDGANPAAATTAPEAAGKDVMAAHAPRPESNVAAPSAPNKAPNQVIIDNFTLDPPTLTVSTGTQVTWINHDDVPHTATSNVKPRTFNSGTLDTDDQFSYVFNTPGSYDYFCALHPKMTGRIVVK